MKKFLILFFSVSTFTILFSGCSNHEEALKTLPNELSLANECKNSNKSYEKDCYDLIAYKNSFAQLRLGIFAQKNENFKEAFQRYLIAQKNGNFYANALLADLYNKGLGVKKDKEQVIDLLKDVKEVDPIAAHKLAHYYINKKDYDEAIELLNYSANNNLKKAQYDLYKIYNSGEITEMNLDKSKMWFERYEDKTNSFIRKIYGI